MKIRTFGFAALLCSAAFAGSAIAQDHQTMQGMKMGSMTMPAGGEVVGVGDLEISGGFAKAMLPGQPVGGAARDRHEGLELRAGASRRRRRHMGARRRPVAVRAPITASDPRH